MAIAVPPLYRRPGISPLPATGRLLAGCLSLAFLSLLVLAAFLPPNPSGMGTHRSLGLPECGFLAATGLPCPSCGMTTSFAWFARGNLLASIYVQPMGAILALLCAMAMWTGVYTAVTGIPAYRLLGVIPSRYLVIPLLALAVMAWGWKMFIHLHGIDGWR